MTDFDTVPIKEAIKEAIKAATKRPMKGLTILALDRLKMPQLLLAVFFAAFFSAFFSVNAGAAPLLTEVRYNPLQATESEIEFVFDEAIVLPPKVAVLSRPARIELFFDQADFEPGLKEVMIGKAGVQNIKTAFVDEGFKATVYLDHLKLYKTASRDSVFHLRVFDDPPVDPSVDRAALVGADGGSPGAVNYSNKIQALDFRRGAAGEGRVLVFLDNSQSVIDVTEQDDKVRIEFFNTDLLPELLYQLDVMDFATVVSSLETFKTAANSAIVISTTGPYSFEHRQIENVFSIDFKKDASKDGSPGAEKQYYGKAISLNFQDIPIRTVLQIIADYNGFNLVTSDSVSGSITLRLDGTPWDQALDIVLKVKGLDKRMEGNILMVAPTEELRAREAKELQAKQQVEKLEPLIAEFIQINYAKATEVAALLQSEGTSFISARGAISVDQRTNTLLIKDTRKSIEDVRKAITFLDVAVKQVVIEARMVTVKDNVSEEMGIRWGMSDRQGTDGYSGTLDGAQTISTGTIPPVAQRLNVNLPVSSPAGSIAFHVAKLIDGTILDLELSALERENKGEIIASPRIMTANQQKARIEQGTEIPFVSAASSGATTVEFKKAVLSLEVTPHITPDNRVILDLIITQDTRGDTVPTATGTAVAIDTQKIQTQVLVENGETIVLGGIFQQQIVEAVSKVPLLGDIPYLGRVFRSDSVLNEKKELLIFVTPKIVTNTF